MTDSKARKGCPFCGAEVDADWPNWVRFACGTKRFSTPDPWQDNGYENRCDVMGREPELEALTAPDTCTTCGNPVGDTLTDSSHDDCLEQQPEPPTCAVIAEREIVLTDGRKVMEYTHACGCRGSSGKPCGYAGSEQEKEDLAADEARMREGAEIARKLYEADPESQEWCGRTPEERCACDLESGAANCSEHGPYVPKGVCCGMCARLEAELDDLRRLSDLMERHGYIESRWCEGCQHYERTVGNECFVCGRDT